MAHAFASRLTNHGKSKYFSVFEGRPSPGRLRSQLPPYVGYHVCMSVCLSHGLAVICANSKCERKRPDLGRPSVIGLRTLQSNIPRG